MIYLLTFFGLHWFIKAEYSSKMMEWDIDLLNFKIILLLWECA